MVVDPVLLHVQTTWVDALVEGVASVAVVLSEMFGQMGGSDAFGRRDVKNIGIRTDIGQTFAETGTTIRHRQANPRPSPAWHHEHRVELSRPKFILGGDWRLPFRVQLDASKS